MNYEEVRKDILINLEYSLEELENLDNRNQIERQGVDVQNDIERYSALINSFKIIVNQAKAFDRIKAAFYDSVTQSEFEIRVSEILRSMK